MPSGKSARQPLLDSFGKSISCLERRKMSDPAHVGVASRLTGTGLFIAPSVQLHVRLGKPRD
jgi:hypothetical protein